MVATWGMFVEMFRCSGSTSTALVLRFPFSKACHMSKRCASQRFCYKIGTSLSLFDDQVPGMPSK